MSASPQRLDDRAIDVLTGIDHGPLRPVLTGTARATDFLLPWIAATAQLFVSRTPGARPAAVRGWTAMALSSLTEDGLLKPLIHRGRPRAQRFPSGERRHTDPSTSAFPSGHIGAGVAFAVATRRDAPRLAQVMAVVAAATTYARLYTGRHYLTDGIVGAAVGAVAGTIVLRLPLEGPEDSDADLHQLVLGTATWTTTAMPVRETAPR